MASMMEIMQHCRLCLVKEQVNIPIFEEHGDIRQIFLKITACLPIKVDREDNLPKKICDGCLYKLDLLYDFWNTSSNAEKQLLSWLSAAGLESKAKIDEDIVVSPTQVILKEEPLSDIPNDIPNDISHDLPTDQTFMQDPSFKPIDFAYGGDTNFQDTPETITTSELVTSEGEPEPKRPRRAAAAATVAAMAATDIANSESDEDVDDPSAEQPTVTKSPRICIPISPCRKRSKIWLHFNEITMTKSLCNYCAQVVSHAGGSTGNLRWHLKAKHPGAQYRSSGRKIKGGKDPIFHTAHAEIHPTPPSSESDLEMPRVLNITNECIKVNKPVSANKAFQYDIQLAKMVVKEFHAFSLVEEKEFKKLIHILCPGYTLPTKKALAESLIRQLYTATLEIVRNKINAASYVCLSVKSWTSINGENLFAITAHFLDNNFMKCAYFLQCAEFSEGNLSEIFKNIIHEWCLENKVVAVVSDNAPNIVRAIGSCGWNHLQCFAHTIDQIVTNGFFVIKTIVNKIKHVIKYFKRNPVALDKLSEMQKQMGMPNIKLKVNIPNQWYSKYDMIKRILIIKDAVITTLALGHDGSVNPLSSEEWNVAEKSKDILEIFDHVTNEVITEKYVSISKVIIMVQSIHKHISRFSKDSKLPKLCESMLNILNVQLVNKFQKIEDIELINQPMFLDPRFKKYGFSDQHRFVETYNTIKNSDNDNLNPEPTVERLTVSDNEKSEQYTGIQEEKSSIMVWGDFDARINNSMHTQISSAAITKEMDLYLQEPVIKRSDDPLRWWSERAEVYPQLIELVKKRLCIVAASVSYDKIYSKAGQMLMERSNHLRSMKVNQIVFLYSNIK